MADKKKIKKTKEVKKEIEKKKDIIKEFKIAYRGLEDPKKYYTRILIPLIILGIIVFLMPLLLTMVAPFPLNINPISFTVGGIVPIILVRNLESFRTDIVSASQCSGISK